MKPCKKRKLAKRALREAPVPVAVADEPEEEPVEETEPEPEEEVVEMDTLQEPDPGEWT